MTKNLLQPMDSCCPTWVHLSNMSPLVATNFQSFGSNSNINQISILKFSAFVYHMSGPNWLKNFSHCSISGSVAPSSMQKLWTPLAAIFVEKKIWKKIWCGSRPIQVTTWKKFLISWKNWRFEIFGTSKASRASSPWLGPSGKNIPKIMGNTWLQLILFYDSLE